MVFYRRASKAVCLVHAIFVVISYTVYAFGGIRSTIFGAVVGVAAFATNRSLWCWTFSHEVTEVLTVIATFDVVSIVHFAGRKSQCYLIFEVLKSFS